MGENLVGLFCVPHVFLNSKVVHAQIKVQRGSHTHRTQVGSAVASGTYLINLRQGGNLAQMSDSAGMHHGGPDVVNKLLLDPFATAVVGTKNWDFEAARGYDSSSPQRD